MSRSPSGVASLRARFEQNKQENDTSPPSRGRSPAGSITSESNRPLSKVRTNFVAVEPSGRRVSTLEVPNMDGASDSNIGGAKEVSGDQTRPDDTLYPNGDAANPDKRVSAAEDDVNGMLPSDPKDESTISGGDALVGSSEGLGSILKGSPFEGDGAQQKQSSPSKPTSKLSQPSKSTPHNQKSDTRKQDATARLQTQSPANAKPRSSIALAGTQTSKGADSGTANPKPLLNGKPADPKKKEKETEVGQGSMSSVKTQKTPVTDTAKAPEATKEAQKTPDISSPKSVKSPGLNGTRPTASKSEPVKQKERAKQTVQKTSDTSKSTAKPPTATAKPTATKRTISASTAPKPASKSDHTDPTFSKPRPKSPTKPVRLPAAATAPTASSAAKHEAEANVPASRSRSRQSSISNASKGPVASLSKPARPVRASLPPNSRPFDKPKTKPRASMASTTASSGNFLERMMRPTQSSAQKTHEKVEPKSPPKKNVHSAAPTSKPKRKSGESTESKTDDKAPKDEPKEAEELKTTGLHEEALLEPTQDEKDAEAVPLTNDAADSESVVGKESVKAEIAAQPQETY